MAETHPESCVLIKPREHHDEQFDNRTTCSYRRDPKLGDSQAREPTPSAEESTSGLGITLSNLPNQWLHSGAPQPKRALT